MSDELKDSVNENGNRPDHLTGKVGLEPVAEGKAVLLLPGMVAIALYMLVLAAVISFGVVGKHIPVIFLLLAPFFVTASFGLLRMFRWAWALTLSAVFLLMSYNLWLFFEQKQAAAAIQGLLNLVFFFYLVRVDVRKRLR
jgi:hypothetical protein